MTLVETLGTALFETHGKLCQELIDAGYDLDSFYNGADRWGDFRKVLIQVAIIRGATSYDEYREIFETIKQEDDQLASKQLFSRQTGIYTPRVDTTQTDRTRKYRQRQREELLRLRELTAKTWIDEHLDEAKQYITDKN